METPAPQTEAPKRAGREPAVLVPEVLEVETEAQVPPGKQETWSLPDPSM